jgi:iron complex outermembrane recepter protein
MTQRLLLLSASALALMTNEANAQQFSPPPIITPVPPAATDAADAATPTPPSTAASVQTEADPGGLSDIVVTAQRRSQNIQDVPIQIVAISGNAITEAGIRDPRDLTLLVPNLAFQSGSQATSASIFIRGVGISDFNANVTGAVGVYVDDVFIGANSGKLFNIFDSDGIEVLKGPQGTLYGRNTTAGAVRFSSRKPTDILQVDAAASYGRFNEVQLEGGIGGPIVPGLLKVRVAGTYTHRDGTDFNRVTGNRLNNLNLGALRGIVDFTPSDSLLLRASVHWGRNRSGARQFQHRGQGIDLAGNSNFSASGVPLDAFGYADTDGNRDAGDYDVEGKESVDVFGASLLAQLNLDTVTLTSITAYEQVNHRTLEDTDASPNNVITGTYIDRPRQFSQELRLASRQTGAFTWLVGGFYFHDTLRTDSSYDILRVLRDPTAPLGGFDPANSIGIQRFPYTQRTESFAVFGQGDYHITDRLTATLGGRYSSDRIKFAYSSFFDDSGVVVPIVSTDQAKTFRDFSYRAALAYKFDRTLLYASASKGYNSGGFAGGASTDPVQLLPYRSEKLYAYEAGLKTDFLDRRVRFNAAAFYYDYRDLQVFVFDTSGTVPVQRKLNAGSAELYGLETDVTIRPTRNLSLNFATSLLHAKYTQFTALAAADYTGNRLVSAPTFAISGGATYTRPIGSLGSLRARVDGSYQSRVFLTPDNVVANQVKPYGLLNARLSWLPDGDRVEAAFWAKNITGTRYLQYVSPVITQDELNYNDPPTYGIQVVVHFK